MSNNGFKEHISLEINSRRRTKGSIENFTTYLDHQITFSQKPSKSYWLRLENVQIPFSFYQLTNFNVFQVIEEDAGMNLHTLTITVDPGNYTITELLTELESALDTASAASGDTNTYTLAYDDITNKVTFSFTAGAGSGTIVTIDTIANGSTMNGVLGIGKADTTNITGGDTTLVLAVGVESVAPNCVDLHTVSYVIVETDITSQNYYNEDRQLHLGARVPINVDRNEVQYFANFDGHLSKMNNKGPLSSISFILKDEFGNVLDLCEVDWSCEVVISELTELHKSSIGHPNIPQKAFPIPQLPRRTGPFGRI